MAARMTPDEAALQLRTADTLGMPHGPGQPQAFLEALGRRTDWTDLRIFGAALQSAGGLFTQPGVHYLSMFYDPAERLLRDSGANVSFAPMDFRRGVPHYAAARTRGYPPEHTHAVHVNEIDVLIETDRDPLIREMPEPTERDRAIAKHVHSFVSDGATLQTGVGSIPSVVATLLAEGDGGDYGIHSELFTPGLMKLHQAGKITNRKGQFDGVSVASFAAGNRELYDWLDGNDDVAFLPVDIVNSPAVIHQNRLSITINGAISVDIHGQVVADTINARQYSGIGGHEDFVAGPALSLEARSLLCLPATITLGDELHSRIVPWFDAGTVITTPRHQVDVIVTEYGAAELQGLTVRQRGEALAAIAHPAFRENLRTAAQRASGGRSPVPRTMPGVSSVERPARSPDQRTV